MNAREYHQAILQVIGDATFVLGTDISVSEIDVNVCYVRGTLFLPNDCELHIAEYVITFPSLHRPKYRYHLQKSDGSLLARWDNVPHYPSLTPIRIITMMKRETPTPRQPWISQAYSKR